MNQRHVTGPILSVVVLVVGLGVCGAETLFAGPTKGNSENGKKLYGESCQHCHGAKGDGQSDMAAYLTPPPSNLTAKATQAKTDGQLRKTILEGRPGTAMSGFDGAFEDAHVADVIAYIRSLKP